jgi:hypothetical protein
VDVGARSWCHSGRGTEFEIAVTVTVLPSSADCRFERMSISCRCMSMALLCPSVLVVGGPGDYGFVRWQASGSSSKRLSDFFFVSEVSAEAGEGWATC